MKTTPIPYNNDGTAPYSDLDTSRDAAVAIEPKRPTLREIVFNAIENSGANGLTDFEIEHRTRLKHQTASARRRELELDDRIVWSGKKRARPTGGVKSKVWIVKGMQIDIEDLDAAREAERVTKLDVIKSKLCKKIKAMDENDVVKVWALLKSEDLL